ncbi:MAG: basic secretory protein-like protein [Verrucomicrobiota bacterium]
MTPSPLAILGSLTLSALTAPLGHAAPKVDSGRSPKDIGFKIGNIPPPSKNDAATAAKFTLLDGEGSKIEALNDGRVPSEADDGSMNFFFKDGSDGGRIQVDLGKAISIKAINSYSWHPAERAAQSYKLYAAKGDEKDFNPTPKRGPDPRTSGWKPIAKVTTGRSNQGGQHAAAITDPRTLSLGEFRYLLFDFEPADSGNQQSNTFLSEIDVIDAKGPAPEPFVAKVLTTYQSPDKKYTFIVDSTITPELGKWAAKELMPVVYEWYPKMVAMLPSDRYTAPETVIMEFRDDLGGTPAYAIGNKLCMSIPFFKDQLEGEAKGCVIHELVHIIQNYWRASTTNPSPSPTPGWVTEGIPDYIRWFLYEPKSKGAEITEGNYSGANYDSSYRVSANFLNWVAETHDKDFIRKLNAAAREGKYSEKVWKDSTGKTAAELGADWKAANAKRLGI